MKHDREIFRQTHKGISIEVSKHFGKDYSTDKEKDVWCFYLLLAAEQFPKEFHDDLYQPFNFSDYGTPMQPYAECLKDLDWHSGMTYYERTSPSDFPFKTFKAGCDFNHLWDEHEYFDAESVMNEAKRCVDSLFLKFPTLATNEILWKEFREKHKAMTSLNKSIDGGGNEFNKTKEGK
jgi:hypothetical protein